MERDGICYFFSPVLSVASSLKTILFRWLLQNHIRRRAVWGQLMVEVRCTSESVLSIPRGSWWVILQGAEVGSSCRKHETLTAAVNLKNPHGLFFQLYQVVAVASGPQGASSFYHIHLWTNWMCSIKHFVLKNFFIVVNSENISISIHDTLKMKTFFWLKTSSSVSRSDLSWGLENK